MSERKYGSFEEFWPFYVSQHQNKVNRNFHFVGSTFTIACLFLGIFRSPYYFIAMPFTGYGFAWFGHYVFERNTPATFTYPFWSFVADWQMFLFMCIGRMDREVKRMGVLHAE